MLALFIQNLSSNVYNLILYSMFSNPSVGTQFILSAVLMVLLYSLFYVLIVKRFAKESLDNMLNNMAWIWLIAVGIFVFFLHYLFWVYGIREVWVVYPPLILCDILGLGVALGFVELRTKMQITKSCVSFWNWKRNSLK